MFKRLRLKADIMLYVYHVRNLLDRMLIGKAYATDSKGQTSYGLEQRYS